MQAHPERLGLQAGPAALGARVIGPVASEHHPNVHLVGASLEPGEETVQVDEVGVAFTFGFTDSGGAFTDIDGNGKLDTAFREIYYDPSFSWADDGSSNVDVETVALHEAEVCLNERRLGNSKCQRDAVPKYKISWTW